MDFLGNGKSLFAQVCKTKLLNFVIVVNGCTFLVFEYKSLFRASGWSNLSLLTPRIHKIHLSITVILILTIPKFIETLLL